MPTFTHQVLANLSAIPLLSSAMHALSAQLNLLTSGTRAPIPGWDTSSVFSFDSGAFFRSIHRRESVICFAIAATMTLETFSKRVCVWLTLPHSFVPHLLLLSSFDMPATFLFLLVWQLSAFSFTLMQLCTVAFAFYTEYLLWEGGEAQISATLSSYFSPSFPFLQSAFFTQFIHTQWETL